jgi:tryptophanyl-tRNA synthetase
MTQKVPVKTTARKRVVSGMRPTGPLHIGNVHGALDTWKKMQDDYDCFFLVADFHALTTWDDDTNVAENTREVLLDWLSYGLDPAKCTLFRQSDIVEIPPFHLLLSMFAPVGWLLRNPTYKDQVEQLKIESPSYGFLGYPVLQAADILLYRGELVPIGKDQAAHLNLTIDLAESMVQKFGPIFPVPGYLHSEFAVVPGTDNRKMSKSYGNAIYLNESEQETTKKIMTMFTDPLKPYKNDPGHPDDCPVYYLDRIYVKDSAELAEIKRTCESGQRGCVQCKKDLASRMNAYLKPIRERRIELAGHPEKVEKIVHEGAEKARVIAREVLAETMKAVKLR